MIEFLKEGNRNHEAIIVYLYIIMDFNTKKAQIIEWVNSIENPDVLETLIHLMNSHSGTTDWWKNLSDDEKRSIELGLEDIKNGRVTPNEDLWEKYKKWL